MSEDRLAVMIAEYEQCREDERTFHTVIAAVYTVGVTLLGALAAYVSGGTGKLPEPAMALTPLVPIALFAFCVPMGLLATVRSYHARELERQMTELAPAGGRRDVKWMTLTSAVRSLRGRTSSIYGLLAGSAHLVVIVAALLTFGGAVVYLATQVSSQWRSVMLATYVPMLAVILVGLYAGFYRGRRLYEYALLSASDPSTSVPTRAGVLAYFALPRPADLVKAPFVVLGVWIGCLIAADPVVATPWEVVHLTLFVLVVFELLGYQARYQWNDLRGAVEDAEHPRTTYRRRLPVAALTLRPALAASQVTMWLRIFAAVALASGDWWGTRDELLLSLAAMCLLAVAYEWVRARDHAVLTAIVVTLGYPLRVAVGLLVVGARPADQPVVFWTVLIATLAFGLAFVGLTWAHEGVDVRRNGAPRPIKPHLALFARHVPAPVHVDAPLAPRGALWAPWNWALCVSALALAVAIAAAGAPGSQLGAPAIAAVALGGALAVVVAPSARLRAAALGGALLAGTILALLTHPPALVIPLWVASAAYVAVYVAFRSANYEQMSRALNEAAERVTAFGHWLRRAFLGRQTTAVVETMRTRAGSPPPQA